MACCRTPHTARRRSSFPRWWAAESARRATEPLIDCRDCARLAALLDGVRSRHPAYHAHPVVPFGDPRASLLIVGLAPGMHGANRTGRPFTGDFAGILLYDTLHRFGFADRSESVAADDGLRLADCRITNAVKCLPPENKPTPDEVRTCNRYLAEELRAAELRVILALGQVAHKAVLMGIGLPQSARAFAHGTRHALPGGRVLFDSYHCSRYNTQTRRLTAERFQDVFRAIRAEL